MWEAFANAKASHIFSAKILVSVYAIFDDQRFNNRLTNDIVSFEQLGPEILCCTICDLEVKVILIYLQTFMLKFKFLEAKHNSGELHCPATSLIYKGDNFVISCLLSCKASSFWKEIYSKRKEFGSLGSKFFPFRVDPFSEGNQNNFKRPPWKCINSHYRSTKLTCSFDPYITPMLKQWGYCENRHPSIFAPVHPSHYLLNH